MEQFFVLLCRLLDAVCASARGGKSVGNYHYISQYSARMQRIRRKYAYVTASIMQATKIFKNLIF